MQPASPKLKDTSIKLPLYESVKKYEIRFYGSIKDKLKYRMDKLYLVKYKID